ncbi:MAG TPA: ATP-binding protein [Stellaceae bacterium]
MEALYNNGETDRVERKESANDGDKVRQAICAFANDLPNYREPGVIFIGQRDDLSCANLQIDDRLLQQLGGWRAEGRILPFPVMHVTNQRINGCDVAVIVVEPSDNPPVKFDGRVWIRTGPRRATATLEEERRLLEKRRWGNLTFDAHGMPGGATLDDINLRSFAEEYLPSAFPPDVIKENGRSDEEKLRALRLLTPQGLPTVTALLVLGKNVRAWIPGAYVQFLRIDGLTLVDPIRNERTIDGTLGDQLRALDELIKANIEQRAIVGGVERQTSWDYPEVALRQLLRNALLHRTYEGTNAPVRITWYNDRVEIQSPGGPYGQVTRDNFGQPGVTDYRNPNIAEALKNLGYVERFGVGIAIAKDALAKNNNPELEYTIEDQHVHVMVPRAT